MYDTLMNKIKAKCKRCTISFITKGAKQKFCSILCCQKYHSPIQVKKTNKRNREIIKSIFSWHDRQKRICLKCDKLFLSQGKFNRLCKLCKNQMDFNRGSIINVFS